MFVRVTNSHVTVLDIAESQYISLCDGLEASVPAVCIRTLEGVVVEYELAGGVDRDLEGTVITRTLEC